MKKSIIKLGLLTAMLFSVLHAPAAVPAYDAEAARANAQADFANWMKYLPDDVFVAHVSIPGTHDTATGHGFNSTGLITASTHAKNSQTQEVTIDQQLAGGIRAFDFRPGVPTSGTWYLNCNHGISPTKITMDEAFTKLTNYLDAHPSEFYVIHLFRGNVYQSGAPMYAYDSDSDKAKYNQLMDEFFNKGKFADYFIEYSPLLKVKDVRGKIIVFRRDRIDFVHISKAGNLSNWPEDSELWNENSKTTVTLESDPAVKGVIRVTDVSSPDNANELEIEKQSIQGLFEWNCNQTLPNDAKRSGSYKPDWSLIFTSGAYGGENTSGYKKNAAVTNPLFTGLIKSATKKGPTGIVLSDWVLTDNYNAQGVELVPTIIYNNFDYISDYILDDELFTDDDVEYENIWDDSKWYFMRNVGTGDFLSAGQWYGTHAATAPHGIKVRLVFSKSTGEYAIGTTLNRSSLTSAALGKDCYVDNTNDWRYFKVTHLGGGKYSFTYDDNGTTKTLAAMDLWDKFAGDGTTHNADYTDYVPGDPMNQWELITVEDYLQQQLKAARRDKGMDVSFLITGGRFFGNEYDINSWNFSSTSAKKENPGVGFEDGNEWGMLRYRRVLSLQNESKPGGISGWGWNATWSLTKDVTDLPNGIYTLRWKAYNANCSGVTMSITINNTAQTVTNQIQSGSISNFTASGALATIGNEMEADKYTCKIENFKLTNGKITIKASTNTAHSTPTALILDDFELIYYGPIYTILERAIDDAKRRLGSTPDWLKVYETKMNNLEYNEADEGAAPALEIYKKLRELTLAQTPDDTMHQDYTNAIINAGFETGTMMGWDTSYPGEGNDTGVRPNEGVYVTQGGHNTFLFNCYQWDPNPENDGRGVILSQTIPGLPAGHYLVTAQAANDEGGCMYIEVNGQRSEALIVEEAKNVAKLISFEFEVAENTEEVTISFFGGNSDGSFDDYGGNWYKVDDIHLYRSGSADYCVFYRRLLEAMERINTISAKTLPKYYQEKWDNEDYHTQIAQLLQFHLSSDHTEGNLFGSNGLEERTELFNHFSRVVLSQAETKANMSGAIRNNSFELGDLSYWNTKASPVATSLVTDSKEDLFNIAGRDEKHIYYANLHDYNDYNGEAYPIYQTISGLPKGKYRLSASVASNNGNTFYLAANGNSKLITTTGETAFQTEEVEFEITEEGADLLLGLYPSADGNFTSQEANAEVKGPWYAVDNFRLWLVGRNLSIDWTMETPTHGTIIMPFAVSAEKLAEEGLEVYSVTSHVESNAAGVTHRILEYTKQPSMEANTPYLVMLAGASAENQPQAVKASGRRAAEAATGATYTFNGFTENEKMNYTETYTNGDLTGTFVETDADDQQYHLQNYEDNIGFVRHEEGVEHETFAPYHAYITLPEAQEGDPNVHGLYFEEPTLPLDWFMEGAFSGTIILPFDAEIPDHLKAYTISTELGEKKELPGEPGIFYQLLTLTPAERFEASVPYLVMSKSVEAGNPAQPASFKAAARVAVQSDDNKVTFKGKAVNTTTENTDGLLTGVHVDKTIADSEKIHTLAELDDNTAAFLATDGANMSQVDAHHAFISSAQLPPDHAEVLLLSEPNSGTTTGIEDILANGEPVDIYTTAGIMVRSQVVAAEGLRDLAPGIYILQSGQVSVKVIKK